MLKKYIRVLLPGLITCFIIRKAGFGIGGNGITVILIALSVISTFTVGFFKFTPYKILLSLFLLMSLGVVQYIIQIPLLLYFIFAGWIIFFIASFRKLQDKTAGMFLYIFLTVILITSVTLDRREFHNFYRSSTFEEYILNKYPEQQGLVADLYINKYKKPQPEKSEILLKEAYAEEEKKNYQAALKLYNKSIDQNPDDPIAYHRRGFLKLNYLDLNFEIATSAVKDFSRAIRLNKDFAYAYFHRSLALSYLGYTERSFMDGKKVFELDGNLSEEEFQKKYSRSKKFFLVPLHS